MTPPPEKKNNNKASTKPRAAGVATLADVAAAAEVSISTAGRVLRGSSLPVAAQVAERVREAATRLRYVPNVAARSLRGVQPRMVGLVVGDMLDPYYGEIAEVVTQAAETRHGMLAIVCNMQRDPRLELKYCRQLWEHRVAGLILTGGGFDQHVCMDELASLTRSMQAAGVVVTTLGPRFLDAPVFSPDNAQVGRAAAQPLLAAGHRQVGIVTGPSRSETARQRLEGSLAALRAGGASVDVRHADFTDESVVAAIAGLIDHNPGLTGILAGSDYMARVCMAWLQAHGRPVPQRMSVVGIGDTPAARPAPRLTSIDIQLAACSRAALECIAAGVAAPETPFVSPEAEVRAGETVAPPG